MTVIRRRRTIPGGLEIQLPWRLQAKLLVNKREHVLQRLVHLDERFRHESWLLEQKSQGVVLCKSLGGVSKMDVPTVGEKMLFAPSHHDEHLETKKPALMFR